MISNITSLMQINFSPADIENTNITTLKFKNDLLDKKDIILYSTIHRLDEPIILNLVSKIFFQYAKGNEPTAKYIKALYEAEVIAKNPSKVLEFSLERFGDWAIYPDIEIDKESMARFVELLYRYEKLNYSQNLLQSMMTYWQDNVSPKAAELKTSLNLLDCTVSKTMMYEHDNNAQSSEGYQDYISNVASAIASVGLTCFIGYLTVNFPFHHPMVEHEW